MIAWARAVHTRRRRLIVATGNAVGSDRLARLGALVRRAVTRLGVGHGWMGMPDAELGRRVLIALCGAVLGPRLLPGASPGRIVLGAALAVAGGVWLDGRPRQGSLDEHGALPAVFDRMAICAMAGASVERSLRIVTKATAGPVGQSLRAAVARLDAGGSTTDAYDQLLSGSDGGSWIAPVSAMERAERLGVPVADALVAIARDQRSQLRAIVQARVRAAPVKVVFPLVVCFLPAFLALAVGPVALSAVRTLSSL